MAAKRVKKPKKSAKSAKNAGKTAVSAPAAVAEPRKSVVSAEISLAEAAELLGLTKQWINRLGRDGFVPKTARGRYRLVDVVQGYVRFLKDEERRTSKSASASRVQDARAREIELRTAREEHTLIETDEAIAVCDEIVGAYKSELAGLAARVTRDIDLRNKIETEVDDVCRRVAARFEQRASDLRSSGEVIAPDAEDDA